MASGLTGTGKDSSEFIVKFEGMDSKGAKQFDKSVDVVIGSLNKLSSALTDKTLELSKGVARVVTGLSTSAERLSKITSDQISKIGSNLQKLGDSISDTINEISKGIDEDAVKKVGDLVKVASGTGKTLEDYAEFSDEKRKLGSENLKDSIYKMYGSIPYANNMTTEAVSLFGKANHEIKTFLTMLTDLSQLDTNTVNQGFSLIDEAIKVSLDEQREKVQIVIDKNRELYELELEQIRQKQLLHQQYAQENHDKSMQFNEETRQAALKQRTAWFDELKDKGLKTALFGDGSEGSGKLGGDIKSALLNGLKGALTGALVGLAFKALKTIGKILLAPLNIAKKLATGVFGFLRKSLTSAETFKKLIELVMLPFTLLFTLLFAPILVKLAPLLVDLVNQVVSKWDVLESVGEKIGEILTYFFDEDQWFSFSNIIDTIINVLDELATVALDTFNASVNAGRQGLEVLVDVATTLIFAITDKIVNFLLSPECFSLMTSIGTLVGVTLYNGLRVAFAAIVPLLEGIGGVIGGLFGSFLYDAARYAWNLLKQKIVALLPFLQGWSEFQNINTDASSMFSNTVSAGKDLLNYITNGLNSTSTGDIINNSTSYSTTNYYPSGTGYGNSTTKDLGW